MKTRIALILFGGATFLPTSVWSQGGTDAAYVDFMKRTCGSGQTPGSCRDLAEAYAAGKGVPKDPAKAAESYKRWADLSQAACDKGQENACSDLARAYETGHGVPQDAARAAVLDKKALPLFQQGCDQGNGYDCDGLGSAYQYGRAVPKDPARAESFYKKGCDAQCTQACEHAKALNAR